MSIKALVDYDDQRLCKCSPNQSMLDVVKQMVSQEVNATIVVEADGKLAGIITDHDVMQALDARDGNLDTAQVSDWMTKEVVTCPADTKLTQAISLMGQHKIRHIVVVEGAIPVAVVGIRKVLEKIHQNDETEISVLRDLALVARASLVS